MAVFGGRNVIITVITMLFLEGWPMNCQSEEAKMQGSPDSLILTDQDHRGEVPLAVGGILTLKLECLPGTGYSWDVVSNNRDLLVLQGEPQLEPIKSGTIGGVEYQIFRFRALAAGTNVLELYYMRKWEKGPPLKTYRVNILIH